MVRIGANQEELEENRGKKRAGANFPFPNQPEHPTVRTGRVDLLGLDAAHMPRTSPVPPNGRLLPPALSQTGSKLALDWLFYFLNWLALPF